MAVAGGIFCCLLWDNISAAPKCFCLFLRATAKAQVSQQGWAHVCRAFPSSCCSCTLYNIKTAKSGKTGLRPTKCGCWQYQHIPWAAGERKGHFQDIPHPKAGVWNGSSLWSTYWLSRHPSQIQASKHFPLTLMNYGLMKIHVYICRKLLIIAIPILISSAPPRESLLYFFIPCYFFYFSPSSLHAFFPPYISLAVPSHLPPAPSTTYTVSSTQLQVLLRGREGGTAKGGPVHSPSAWQPQIQATRLVQKIRKQLN